MGYTEESFKFFFFHLSGHNFQVASFVITRAKQFH